MEFNLDVIEVDWKGVKVTLNGNEFNLPNSHNKVSR